MDKNTIITAVISLLGSGGFLTGIYMLMKLKPEAGQITVTAAQGALIVQTGVIESLQKEIERLKKTHEEEMSELKAENALLRKKLSEFENKLNKLDDRTISLEGTRDGT